VRHEEDGGGVRSCVRGAGGAHRGTTLGDRAEIKFEPVEARRVRLSILRATEGSTIREVQLFGPRGKAGKK
jgi:hypothetical protein